MIARGVETSRGVRRARGLRLLLSGTILAAGLAGPAVAAAAATAAREQAQQAVAGEYRFDIPAQSLATALNALGRQGDLQVTMATGVTEGVESRPVVGTFTVEEALRRLLAGSGITWYFTGERTVVLERVTEEGATLLDPLRVEGEAGAETAWGPVDGLVARRSATATKTDTPLVETPRSVSVVTAEEMEERGVQTMVEAVRYSAGVGTGAFGLDPRFDQIYVRGFSVTTIGDYRDGLRQPYSAYGTFRTEPYNLERVEILKGPASSLYGQSAAGGLVNRVSKLPTEEARGEAVAQYGTEDRKQGAVDLSGPIDAEGQFLYRVVGLAREGETNFEIEDDRLMLAPSFTWRPSEDTTLTLIGLAQKDETDSNVAAINRNGEILEIRASDPEYDHQKVEQYQLGYRLDHRFDEVFGFTQNLRYSAFDLDARYLTGSAVGGGFEGDIYHRGATAITEDMDVFQVDNQGKADFETGPLRHGVLLGLDYQWSDSHFGLGSGAADPVFDLDVSDPHYGVDGPTPAITTRTGYEMQQVGLYLQDQVEYDRWRLSFGLRHDWLERTQTDRNTDTVTVEKDETALTGDVGLLYLFDNGVAPYVAYGTAFEPVSSRDASGRLLDPVEAEQFEAGIKFQPKDWNAFFSVAGYHLTQKNVAQYVGVNSTVGAFYESIGEVTVNGVELEGRMDLAEGLKLIVAYSYSDAEITESATAGQVGNTPAVTPKHSASAWLGYDFTEGSLDGLGLGAGVRFVGETYTSNANLDTNDAYALLDFSIDYDLGALAPQLRGASLGVSGTNLTDKKAEICNAGYCYLGQGRTLLGQLKYRW